MAGPADRPPLDLERERATIAKALVGKAFQVEYLERATLKSLRIALLETSPHVVHWIGHGDLAAEVREGELLFEEEDRNAVPVPGAVLAEYFRDTYVRLVVLNGCETGRIPEDPLAGVATALVRAGLPAVIAMQRPVLDDSAIRFSEALYTRLAAGDPVDVALSEARLALFTQDQESLEWAIPVLHLRSPDGRIFVVG
jgi:CHAT domain-containing protein